MPTLYQSYKPEIQNYTRQKEQARPREEKIIFKWKLAIIFFGIILILLIGALSELIKAINDKYVTDYDTTFLYPLLTNTMLLDSTKDVDNFLSGLNSSSEIKFDTIEPLYASDTFDYTKFIDNVSNHENLLYLWDVNVNSSVELKFGFYLQKKMQTSNNGKYLVSEERNHKVSSVFNLENGQGRRLNLSDDCFIYRSPKESIKIAELMDLPFSLTQNSTTMIRVNNWECFSQSKEQFPNEMEKIIGYPLQVEESQEVEIRMMEVFALKMEYDKIKL